MNKDTGYLIDFEHFELLPGAENALRIFQDLGYRLFVVSNQSGVARGYFTFESVEALHRRITEYLGSKGIAIEEMVFCPHHVEGKVAEFTKECDCRKPLPGMLHRLRNKYDLDLKQSYMVGDKRSDAETGVNAGAKGVWLTGTAVARDVNRAGLRLDNDENIKEFVSLIDFAEYLRGFERRPGPAGTAGRKDSRGTHG